MLASASSRPTTAMVWSVAQLPVVNLTVPAGTATALSSSEAIVTSTSDKGWVASLSRNVAVPFSLTVNTPELTRSAAVSSSSTSISTSAVCASYWVSAEAAAAVIVGASSSASSSWTPVTVTVWAVFQFPVVNVRSPAGTDAAPGSSELKDTVTVAVGWVASFTANVAVDPSSTSRVAGATSAAVSSSSTSTATSAVSPS